MHLTTWPAHALLLSTGGFICEQRARERRGAAGRVSSLSTSRSRRGRLQRRGEGKGQGASPHLPSIWTAAVQPCEGLLICVFRSSGCRGLERRC